MAELERGGKSMKKFLNYPQIIRYFKKLLTNQWFRCIFFSMPNLHKKLIYQLVGKWLISDDRLVKSDLPISMEKSVGMGFLLL